MDELTDHIADLKEENMEADASSRLGDPEQVAEAAATAYRRRSFLGRHPMAAFLVFGLSPFVTLCIVVWLAAYVLAIVTGHCTYSEGDNLWILSLMIALCSIFSAGLYGELALLFGLGKKWMLASSAVLGLTAMWCEHLVHHGIGLRSVMLPVQFAVPLAVDWLFANRKCAQRYPATSFVVFAISPFASLMVLWCITAFAISLSLPAQFAVVLPVMGWLFVKRKHIHNHLTGTLILLAISPFATMTLLYSVAIVTNWITLLFVHAHPGTTVCALEFYAMNLTMHVIPIILACLLHCILAKRFGSGRRWMVVSCVVLGTFGAMQNWRSGMYNQGDPKGWPHGLTVCIIVAQVVVPLAVGWWFLWRKRDQRQLQLAA
jgi:hypothetical protein